jgi:hypothetical protein
MKRTRQDASTSRPRAPSGVALRHILLNESVEYTVDLDPMPTWPFNSSTFITLARTSMALRRTLWGSRLLRTITLDLVIFTSKATATAEDAAVSGRYFVSKTLRLRLFRWVHRNNTLKIDNNRLKLIKKSRGLNWGRNDPCCRPSRNESFFSVFGTEQNHYLSQAR